ncbi:MAG TPA: hypothetical protein VFY40_07660, partial [Blastocatellia bacterium]|nr:hypothetical protein [Blastocatellia bacterium]
LSFYSRRCKDISLMEVRQLFKRSPEGQRKLAGGGAKRNHRDRFTEIFRVPAGTPDLRRLANRLLSPLPFRARLALCAIPAATLRFAAG